MKISPCIEKDLIAWCQDAAHECRQHDPDVGIFAEVDRLKAIGNGQVPVVAALAFSTLYSRLIG